MLVEGRLPPKGYLKLSVRMYMDPFDSSSVPELIQESQSSDMFFTGWTVLFYLYISKRNPKQDGHVSAVCLCVCVCSGVSESSGTEMRFVGYVEISDEASLDDLKTQVSTHRCH